MASLSVRRLDGEIIRRLKIRAQRDGLSVEETVRRILADAVVDVEPVGAMIRRIVGDDAIDSTCRRVRSTIRSISRQAVTAGTILVSRSWNRAEQVGGHDCASPSDDS